jgi:hypothetical protein
VAAIVGIPQNTVKTRMFHARKRMADLLRGALPRDGGGLRDAGASRMGCSHLPH